MLLVVGLLTCSGAAQANGPMFTVVQGASPLPSPSLANGDGLVLTPWWTVPPSAPEQLSY